MYYAHDGTIHTTTARLHARYGPVVRMAPNYLDLDFGTSLPALVKTCFDTKGVWRKTDWHAVSGFQVAGPDGKKETKYNIFSEVRPAEHQKMKKPIAKYWTSASVARLEPHVDQVVAFFAQQLDAKFAQQGDAFDFGEWCLFFGWDAVAKTTWSKRLGFLDRGADLDGTLHASAQAARYLVTVGMYPALDRLLDKNPLVRVGPPTYTHVAHHAVQLLTDRLTGADGHNKTTVDFLDCYVQAQQAHPDVVDHPMIVSYMLVNIAAGADTTAAALRSIFYLLLRHPPVWATLRAAVLAAPFAQAGEKGRLPAPYAQARAIPYLEAVIREALRLVPGNLFPQERYVPAGGLILPDGQFVPEGTAVGFSAYTMHRNKAIWGEDAESFRPERWLPGDDEPEDAYKQRMRLYNDCDLSFGAGSRKCIGMNLALLEVYKTVATLVAMFEFELATEEEWTLKAELFPRATGITCRIRRREGVGLRDDIDTSN